MGFARAPVACGSGGGSGNRSGKVHLFCRECALNDLMAQRKEIKRLEKEGQARTRDEVEEKVRGAEDEKRKDLERFERLEAGLSDDSAVATDGTGRKRKREEAEELHTSQRRQSSVAEHEMSLNGQVKKPKSSEASFWIPSSDTLNQSTSTSTNSKTKQHKLHPLCPGSTAEDQHTYSLRSLITINFTESASESENAGTGGSSDEPTRICPSCKKALTNTSRPMLGTAEACGHVVCGACADLFSRGSGDKRGPSKKKNGHGDGDVSVVRCFVCEANLSGVVNGEAGEKEEQQGKKHKKEKNKEGKDKSKSVGRLVEISCEGTGFAGGGANMAKREGVAFQC